jgi:hypothetical protein
LNLSSQNCPFNNNQHGKKLVASTTTTKQTQIYKPNQKQTLKNNQKKRLVHTGQSNNNHKERTHLSRGFIICKIKPLKSPVNKTNPKQIAFISDKMFSFL